MAEVVTQDENPTRRKTLQERLTTLIESNMSLENQKNLLEVQIREQQTNDEENVREIKKFYEAEMCEARRLLNAQAEESARVDMNLQKETKLRTDLEAEKKANLELIAKLKTENQNGLEINEKVNLELEQEKRITERLKTEVDGWKDEANIYHNKLANLKTKYEAEIIDRVAAENKVQGLEEQIALNNRMFEEIASSRVVTTTNDAEARTRPLTDLADEYSTLFEEQLAAFEKERAKMKQDHDEKLDTLTSQLRKLKEDNATAKAEIECYKNQINRNADDIEAVKLVSSQSEAEIRIELEKSKETNEGLVLEITELKEKLDRYEARELESNEVSIKTELNTFESLLECEESRLGLSVETTRKRKAPTEDQANAKKTKTDVDKKCTIM